MRKLSNKIHRNKKELFEAVSERINTLYNETKKESYNNLAFNFTDDKFKISWKYLRDICKKERIPSLDLLIALADRTGIKYRIEN